ncbi:MAG: hypothetical protein HBSAPP04_27990 [Ignavibacteriaceae bacterium]|nr:MAG: hypothetical protein HBSAPP04_27990 [Ignavibacteriaceae bacterium]
MKKRVRRALNFFAFNLLFFALYLNFIHKDKASDNGLSAPQSTAAFNGTVSVENAAKNFEKKTTAINTVDDQQAIPLKTETKAAQN